MDKSQIRECFSGSGGITYNSATGGFTVNQSALNLNNFAGTLGVSKGGTGLTTLGSASQYLRVNSSGTALEYATIDLSTTIGTTGINNGTIGCVLFQGTGNVYQQSANLFWDNTNSRLSIGQGSSPGAVIDVRAAGTGGSNIAFRVRNNGNTGDNFRVNGNGSMAFGGNASGNGLFVFDTGFVGSGYYIGTASTFTTSNAYLQFFTGGFKMQFGAVNDGFQFSKTSTPADNFYFKNVQSGSTRQLTIGDTNAASQFIFYNGNLGLVDTDTIGTSTTKTLYIKNGTSPTGGFTDICQIYSKDITAGNAAIHITNENGNVIKLYQQTTGVAAATVASPGAGTNIKTDDTFDGYTIQQVVKALRNNGLLA